VSDAGTTQPEHPLDAAASPDAGQAHSPIHLPPNSFVPVSIALALAVLFVGLLGDIRSTVGPVMWLVGLLWLIASCFFWARAARREYLELPEDAHH
jgi:hypothetical protein